MCNLCQSTPRDRRAVALLAIVVLAIFLATLLPAPIVEMAKAKIGLPYLNATAHVLLFFALGWVLPFVSRRVMLWHVLGLALFLALTTEGLQHFAVMRHPSWDGVAQDMAGATLALLAGLVWRKTRPRRP